MNFYLYERGKIVSTICDRKSIRNRGLEYCMVWYGMVWYGVIIGVEREKDSRCFQNHS